MAHPPDGGGPRSSLALAHCQNSGVAEKKSDEQHTQSTISKLRISSANAAMLVGDTAAALCAMQHSTISERCMITAQCDSHAIV